MSDEEERAEARLEDAEVSGPDDSPDEFSPFEDLDGEFGDVSRAQYVVGGDGLPQSVDMTQQSDIPALSTESLVCLGDYSKFVIRDAYGHIKDTFTAKQVEQTPNGTYLVTGGELRRVVHPWRPQCAHYVEQFTQMDENPANRKLKRLCAARRSTGGAFIGLNDMGLWACSMREPRDLESEKLMKSFNERKTREGRDRVHLPIQGRSMAPTPHEIEFRAGQLTVESYFEGNRQLHAVHGLRNGLLEPVLTYVYDVLLDGSVRLVSGQHGAKELDVLAAESAVRDRSKMVERLRTTGGSNG